MQSKIKYNFTLLIVEDISSNYLFLESAIGRCFKKVLHAQSGLEAVELCKNNQDIGLVLMDVSMPVMNGFDATRLIKALRPDLPVIALTAYIIDQLEEKLKDAGCSDFMLKPFDYQELEGRIAQLLSSRQSR